MIGEPEARCNSAWFSPQSHGVTEVFVTDEAELKLRSYIGFSPCLCDSINPRPRRR